ncbi:outer membrane beta-barrel protein [Mongoliibacter ruber]|nr:outer membrane beta-barrel protein [Mongoliibacter ruber]
MKKISLLLAVFLWSLGLMAQGTKLSLGGGYAFAKGQQSKERGTGYRINGVYEIHPYRSMVSHGFTLSYATTQSDFQRNNNDFVQEITHIPFTYTPKLMFSEEDSKAYLKGALGLQYSMSNVTGSSSVRKENDFGFYGGLAGGIELAISYFAFINMEYEVGYVSNGFLDNGLLHSAQLGIGVKF